MFWKFYEQCLKEKWLFPSLFVLFSKWEWGLKESLIETLAGGLPQICFHTDYGYMIKLWEEDCVSETMQVCLQACAETPNIIDFSDRFIVAFSNNFQLTQLTTSSCLASIFLLTATTSPMVSPERIIHCNSNSWWSPFIIKFLQTNHHLTRVLTSNWKILIN